jgi:hypothetical protein
MCDRPIVSWERQAEGVDILSLRDEISIIHPAFSVIYSLFPTPGTSFSAVQSLPI